MKREKKNSVVACAVIETMESRVMLSAVNPLDFEAVPQLVVAGQIGNGKADNAKNPNGKPPAPPAPPPAPSGYNPAQIRDAYGISGDGAGQIIAIVDAYDDPNIASDLSVFCSQFSQFGVTPMKSASAANPGNQTPEFVKVTQSARMSSNAGWALETALDVEWAHAIAPKADIILVEAKSAAYGDLLWAVDKAVNLHASVVSMSWGGSEFVGETSYDFHFSANNVTFVAASGDTGGQVIWPSASPNVLSVGGTTLRLNADNTIASEVGWSGSGGGVSKYEPRPSYQNLPLASTGVPFDRRATPDVSYNADPNTGFAVYDTVRYNGQSGWFQVGGTSAGAPQWAALIALANQNRALNGTTTAQKATLGTTQVLTEIYSPSVSSNDFNDIRSSPPGNASVGYDLCTGWGSPFGDALITDLLAA